MSFARYPEYKDSGVTWIGKIPRHWPMKRIKHVLDHIGSGGTPDTSIEEYWAEETGTPWVAIGDMSDRTVVQNTLKTLTLKGLESKKLTVWPAGTLLFSMYASLGHVAVLHVPAATNQAILALVPLGTMHQAFLKRWFEFLKPHLAEQASSNTQDNLNAEKVRNLPTPTPPFSEQTAIATFLDRETAKIDALVAEQEKLIALLQEKRQAVISHAVTKGLDPNVPMKDSGVEWLGEVPAHWEILKGARIGNLFGSEQVPEELVTDEGDLPFIKVGSMSSNSFEIESWSWFIDRTVADRYVGKAGFIVFPKRGAAIFLNKVNIVDRPSLIDPNLMGWEIREEASREFFAYALKSRKLEELADVSTVPQINNKHIAPERFPVPPETEQREIVAFLDAEMDKIDSLVAEAHTAITLLQERRTALISAAVTGQIDVRNWSPQEGV